MRILRVAQKVYPESKGGGAYHVHAMSRDQAAMGHDVTVLTTTSSLDLPRCFERDGYSVVQQRPTIELLGNDLSVGVGKFLRTARDFDVVHAHSHLYFSTNLAAVARRLAGAPLAITNHGLYSQNVPEAVFRPYLHTVGRWTFNQADVVFCYTTEDRERLAEVGVRTRVEVVPNGVDTTRFSPRGADSDLIDHDGATVLFVGRMVEGKRPLDAIKAVARLPKALDAKLFMVGDGPLRDGLEEAHPNVAFLGQVPYDDMPSVYRSGDVLLLPSRAEGLPRTVLEAFATGTPVVTSHLPQIASIVEHGGETVELGDIDGYAAAIERVLEDGAQLGERGRELASEEFRWEETVEKTTAVLHSLSRGV